MRRNRNLSARVAMRAIALVMCAFVLLSSRSDAMSVTPTPTLPSVTQSGRTLTPTGIMYISDARPRTPSGAYTFVNAFNAVDAVVFDVYAIIGALNTYALVPLVTGTSVAGRTDLSPILGQAVDYPSLSRTEWKPADGGSLANHVQVAPDGRTTQIGPTNTAQQFHIDNYGRVNSKQVTGPTVALYGSGSGSGGSVGVTMGGTDQIGVIILTTGASGQVANSEICKVTFSKPFANASMFIAFWNPRAIPPVTNSQFTDAARVYANALTTVDFTIIAPNVLQPNTTYQWIYQVIGSS